MMPRPFRLTKKKEGQEEEGEEEVRKIIYLQKRMGLTYLSKRGSHRWLETQKLVSSLTGVGPSDADENTDVTSGESDSRRWDHCQQCGNNALVPPHEPEERIAICFFCFLFFVLFTAQDILDSISQITDLYNNMYIYI